jgi:hypothetical protein
MPSLMLHYEGGGWEIRVANTEEVIGLVLGEQGVDEAMAVRNLAAAMQEGAEAVVENAEFIFQNAAQIDIEFVNTLFGAADELLMEEAIVFGATEGATLLQEIIDAGEALAALL